MLSCHMLCLQDDDETDSDAVSHQASVEAADKPADGVVVKKSDATLCGPVEDDLTLVAYMYGLLFQCYADKVGTLGRDK